MTRTQRDAVLELAPRQFRRTYTLEEIGQLTETFGASTGLEGLWDLRARLPANGDYDIPDPIGENTDFHMKVASRILDRLRPVIAYLTRT